MKDFLSLSHSRYSVRDYQPKSVGQEDLDYILQCARLAPSACNRQPWHFYVCQSAEALAKVRQCYAREWFMTAPMVIVCTIDHGTEWIRPVDGHTHGIVDVSIAAEHICLAAVDRGLGTCWVCNFDASLCHALFGFAADEEPVILIPVGYPNGAIAEKKRKETAEIVTLL